MQIADIDTTKYNRNHIHILTCPQCNSEFQKTNRQIYCAQRSSTKNMFCSKECRYNNQSKRTLKPCLNCGEPTLNPTFCSRSCNATYNNAHPTEKMLSGRKTKTGRCSICDTPIYKRSSYCSNCRKSYRIPSRASGYVQTKTLEESCVNFTFRSNIYATVRDHAKRSYNKLGLPKICTSCGYSKHVQLCHIKPVSSFSTDALLSEINDPSNLIYLCPNCHWELDHGELSL